jgi:hypothetical protein
MHSAPTFSLKDHFDTVSSNNIEFKCRTFEEREETLKRFISQPETASPSPRVLERAKLTGVWLSIFPSTDTQSVLSSLEFRDALHLRYGMIPPNLPKNCDGCNAPFTIDHALTCNKGGLVIIRHNKLRDELASIAAAAFTPSQVTTEPLIYPAQTPQDTRHSQERGDILIRGFFDRARDCVIDVTISDLDAPSYSNKKAKAALKTREQAKKNRYQRPCESHRRDFVPFAVSADGILGREAFAFMQQLSRTLAIKWNRPYPPVCGYVNAHLSLSLIRACHLCIRGSRQTSTSRGFHLPSSITQYDHSGEFHIFAH